jgi:hypothetical protein
MIFPDTMHAAINITVERREGPWEGLALQNWPLQPEPLHRPAQIGLRGEDGLISLQGGFALPFKPQRPRSSGSPDDVSNFGQAQRDGDVRLAPDFESGASAIIVALETRCGGA